MKAIFHPLHSSPFFPVPSSSSSSDPPPHLYRARSIRSGSAVPWTFLKKSLYRRSASGRSGGRGSGVCEVRSSGSEEQEICVDGGGHRPRANSEDPTTRNDEPDRPTFDLNLAVILAGFAFEAYTTPPDNIGRREVDAADCQTVFLSELFLREIYDGQLIIKLKKAVDLPAMDPWGTSDPYVVFQLEGQVVRSNIKWATKEPIWNEDLTLNIKRGSSQLLQVAAWDANLVTPHKRMGNSGIDLNFLCDGNPHDLVVELDGLGGGGKIYLEVLFKTFDQIDEEQKWWRIPFVSDFFMQNDLASALKSAIGVERVNARQFVQFAFGQLNSLNSSSLSKVQSSNKQLESDDFKGQGQFLDLQKYSRSSASVQEDDNIVDSNTSNEKSNSLNGIEMKNVEKTEVFWENLADSVDKSIIQKLGFPIPATLKWDGIDLVNKASMLLQSNAEEEYIQSGLATPEAKESILVTDNDEKSEEPPGWNVANSLGFDMKKASSEILSQTESILGALMVLTTAFSDQKKVVSSVTEVKEEDDYEEEDDSTYTKWEDGTLDTRNKTETASSEISEVEKAREEDMRNLFSSAESAMEAWALLATSLGRSTFIKSEFEKICFLDNDATDTQVAIWRDPSQRRLVIAFRGTEQVRWKDLRTDLMLLPSGFNPERLGGDFKQEIQVHSGFLSAYDSVRNRIMTLVKNSIGFHEDNDLYASKRWHVYVTGHSLGGALATLLALELSSSRMAKNDAISVTMYNFGSPRVGNRRFVEVYNEKVKDSWRIVNHRDIVPTVPRLMGYCHVAQPVYLAAGDLKNALLNMELSQDGYEGDLIGEYTPDALVNEFMKGEKELIEKILQMEINLFRSIRDGTALMQHMEDFYYITLLESVRSKYRNAESLKPDNSNELVS